MTYMVYCDGACTGNPGPAAWGAVVVSPNGSIREHCGWIGLATNQIAELSAAIGALATIPEGCEVVIYSDSQYLVKGVGEWIDGWKRRGWRTAGGSRVANLDLWQNLDRLRSIYRLRAIWVKGHAGNPMNERADRLARSAIRESSANA